MNAPVVAEEREKLTKKALTADHPTWCPGCGDFAVLAAFYKVLEKRQFPQESVVTLAGIGCSSRFPYFVNTHGAHFIHGRGAPGLGREPLPARPACVSLRRRRRRILHWGKSH
jgi:2-oxoglutarate ferredoxin oxidoreductase subunit beta